MTLPVASNALHQVDHQRIVALAAFELAQPLGGIGMIERLENILALILRALFERAAPAFMESLFDIGLKVRRTVGELPRDLRNVTGKLLVLVPGCRFAIRRLPAPSACGS
jgi:hypothetical protein